jgi:hypothetical protein
MNAPPPRTLDAHPCWPLVAPAVAIESGTLLATGHKHRRIELHTERFTADQVGRILATRIQCAACTHPIAPFRVRRGKSAGRAERPGRLFVALTCELAASIGCSRGKAATEAYEGLLRALSAFKAAPPPPPTGGSQRAPEPSTPAASPAPRPERPEPWNQMGLRFR